MRVGAIIYPLLANYTALTSLVPASKIFALRAEQPTASSYIVYREISSIPLNTNGDSTDVNADPRIKQRSILDTSTVQISVFATTYKDVEDIAVEVRNALDREWGVVNSPYTKLYTDSIVFDSAVDDYDDDFGDRGIYIKHLDFTVRINRDVIGTGYQNLFSLQTDGVDGYLNYGDADVFTPNSSGANRGMSWSFWLKKDANNLSLCSPLSKGGFSTPEYNLTIGASGNITLNLYTDFFNNISASMQHVVVDGQWNHIVFTWNLSTTPDASSIKSYFNGNLSTTSYGSVGSFSGVSNTTDSMFTGFYLGAVASKLEGFDEFSLFDKVLNLEDVNKLYGYGKTADVNLLSIDYLLAYWRMGDPDGTSSFPTIIDQSANSNNATMVNLLSSDITTSVPTTPWTNLYSVQCGISAYVDFGNNITFTPSKAAGGFSVMAWVYFGASTASKIIAEKPNEWKLYTDASGHLSYEVYTDGNTANFQKIVSNGAVADVTINAWNFVGATFLSGSAPSISSMFLGINESAIYGIAGATWSEGGTWGDYDNTANSLYVGKSDIIVSDVRLYSKNFDSTLQTLYFNEGHGPINPLTTNYTGFDEDLTNWWRMGDPNGPSSYPTIVNQYGSKDGEMIGMTSANIITNVPE